MDQRYPESRRFNSTTELRECAEGVVNKFLYGTDDAPVFAARDIAGYQRPHAIALAAQVYAVMDPSDKSSFGYILRQVAFGSYRSVMATFREESDDDPRDRLGEEVEREAYCAIDLLAQNLAVRLRDGTDDAYATAARTIVSMSVEFAILVTFIVCSVLDGSHFRMRRLGKPPADGQRQMETFVAFLAQVALGSDRSVKPGP
jgi:hypothetical protein